MKSLHIKVVILNTKKYCYNTIEYFKAYINYNILYNLRLQYETPLLGGGGGEGGGGGGGGGEGCE